MFSGIVEATAEVVGITREGGNVHLRLRAPFTDELHIDQSVAHNGVCLTVVGLHGDGTYTVTAIQETLDRSNLGDLREGSLVNLERSMKIDGRLDGHIVQGHVDTTAVCTDVAEADGSKYFKFEYKADPALIKKGYVTVEKGSVTVNGVSLTVCDSERESFRVAIIPYTFEHTNFCQIEVGTKVNLEFDIVGKYIARITTLA
ncbi:MAG: riboflavin synthase [Muribaculaceae bacterium]|nr:riboflavin synthase [Muribaculaceae bacterium]